MKTLLIIRHAKSSWEIGTLNDFERPLNDRGKKDAPVMAQRLLDRKIKIDAFVSSPAKRAKRTAELFCEIYKRKEDSIIFISALYHASSPTFYEVIEDTDDKFETVAIFSHNPGISAFVNELSAVRVDNMPTCSVFAVSINTDKWKEFTKRRRSFYFLITRR